jgi:hypothetical protein
MDKTQDMPLSYDDIRLMVGQLYLDSQQHIYNLQRAHANQLAEVMRELQEARNEIHMLRIQLDDGNASERVSDR